MKKSIIVVLLLFLSSMGFAQDKNGIVRLTSREIEENKTPQAVAYNFVMSIVEEKYSVTVDLMTENFFFQLMPYLFGDGIPISQLFSSEYMHDIVEMRPVVKLGYDVVITNSHELDYSGDDNPYKGMDGYSVSFDCANAKGEIYDGSKGNYDTDARVMLVKKDDMWQVTGFK